MKKGIIIAVCLSVGVVGYYLGSRTEKAEQVVASIVAQADSNSVSLARQADSLIPKTAEDSTKLGQLRIGAIYWKGVADAFRSIESPQEVKLK